MKTVGFFFYKRRKVLSHRREECLTCSLKTTTRDETFRLQVGGCCCDTSYASFLEDVYILIILTSSCNRNVNGVMEMAEPKKRARTISLGNIEAAAAAAVLMMVYMQH